MAPTRKDHGEHKSSRSPTHLEDQGQSNKKKKEGRKEGRKTTNREVHTCTYTLLR